MKFYIASRLENAETVSRIAAVLKAAGHIHTYDWTVHGSVKEEGEQRIKEVAEAEMRGVINAEAVIVLLPGGRGTHAELGIALGAGDKTIMICAADDSMFLQDDRTCAFYWNKGTRLVVGTEVEWLEAILATMTAYDNAQPQEEATYLDGRTYRTAKTGRMVP